MKDHQKRLTFAYSLARQRVEKVASCTKHLFGPEGKSIATAAWRESVGTRSEQAREREILYSVGSRTACDFSDYGKDGGGI